MKETINKIIDEWKEQCQSSVGITFILTPQSELEKLYQSITSDFDQRVNGNIISLAESVSRQYQRGLQNGNSNLSLFLMKRLYEIEAENRLPYIDCFQEEWEFTSAIKDRPMEDDEE